MPLFVLCIGAMTNVAAAIKIHPEICSRITIVWIAGHDYARIGKVPFKEYNGTDMADWTAGESWSLGDSPAVGVAIDENCGKYE